MVYYQVDKEYDGNDLEFEPKIIRQLFHYKDGILVQGRLYPQCNDGKNSLYTPIRAQLQKIIDDRTDSWGIKVSAVEVKELELPESMKRAMAKQAEAERERRAKIINAEGELQAAQKLSEAAIQMEVSPITLQLRYLQTLREIAGDKNSTTIFPLPIDLMKPFMERFFTKEGTSREKS